MTKADFFIIRNLARRSTVKQYDTSVSGVEKLTKFQFSCVKLYENKRNDLLEPPWMNMMVVGNWSKGEQFLMFIIVIVLQTGVKLHSLSSWDKCRAWFEGN